MKANPDRCAIPVIVVSVAAAEVGSLFGTVDVVAKPLEDDELRRALARHIGFGEGSGVSVLVVEDDPHVQSLLREQLYGAGVAHVEVAAEGRSALEVLETFTPQLVVLDLLMPGMGGISFLRALRLDVRWVHLPVIVISGRQLDADDVRLLRNEALTVLHKGDDISERLPRLLRSVLPLERRIVQEAATGRR